MFTSVAKSLMAGNTQSKFFERKLILTGMLTSPLSLEILPTPTVDRNDKAKRQNVREIFAHAALSDCPNIVRYYSAWFELDHLYIQVDSTLGFAFLHSLTSLVIVSQMENCAYGNLRERSAEIAGATERV